MTANFLDMNRIMHFLRPMSEGGMGSADAAFIAHCFNWKADRCRAAIDALEGQGRLQKRFDGRYMPAAA